MEDVEDKAVEAAGSSRTLRVFKKAAASSMAAASLASAQGNDFGMSRSHIDAHFSATTTG